MTQGPNAIPLHSALVPTLQGKALLERLGRHYRSLAKAALPAVPLAESRHFRVTRATNQLLNVITLSQFGFYDDPDRLIRKLALRALHELQGAMSELQSADAAEAELQESAERLLRALAKLRVS